MEFQALIAATVVYIVVYGYEGIIMDLIAWVRHRWRDRRNPEPEKSN